MEKVIKYGKQIVGLYWTNPALSAFSVWVTAGRERQNTPTLARLKL